MLVVPKSRDSKFTYLQDTQAEDLKSKLDGIKKSEKLRLKKIEVLEKEIARIQQQIDNPPQFDTTAEALCAEIVSQLARYIFLYPEISSSFLSLPECAQSSRSRRQRTLRRAPKDAERICV